MENSSPSRIRSNGASHAEEGGWIRRRLSLTLSVVNVLLILVTKKGALASIQAKYH
jgi:hypothetical protein